MALNDQSYAHLTAHTNNVIERFRSELREKLQQDPQQSRFWRERYYAYAAGAQAVWMEAAAGLSHPQDAAMIAERVRSLADGE